MHIVTRKRAISLCAAVAAAGLVSLTAGRASAAVITYNFDVNGATAGFGVTTGSTYDWDDTANGGFWSNNSTSTTGNIATNGWVQANVPKFQPAAPAPTYTINVNAVEQITGIFASTAQTLTINAGASGGLEAVAGVDGFLGSSSADVTINAPISGAGTVNPSNGGNLRLNGTNTYTGGTSLTSTSTLVHFSNGLSFGTGPINMGVAGFVPLLASGGATVTLANNFTSTVSGAGVNFAADANTPVTSTGTWTLGANNLVLRNNAGSTSPLKLTNVISGTANITLSTNSTGSTINFSGANTYSGITTITGAGGAGAGTGNVRLILGAPNTIASSSSVALGGGILDTGGFTHAMGSTTLALLTSTGASTIDFAVGAAEIDFANSSAVNWTGAILNLTNWDPSVDHLRFGTDATGLTGAQLAKIEFNGAGLGTASLDSNGFVVVLPEPASLSLLGLGAIPMLLRRRRVSRPGH
jgi:hypothetical protein